MKFPKFWFEANLFFNWVESFEDLKKVFDAYKGHETVEAILDNTRNNPESENDYYGFRRECNGDISLRQFFYKHGIIIRVDEEGETKIHFTYDFSELANYEALDSNTKHEADNYPYGGLRTKAYFSVECSPKKGFRTVFQTINPKTGHFNKESKSTYGNLYVMLKEKSNGHFHFKHLSLNGDDAIEKSLCFIWNNYENLAFNNIWHDYICYFIAGNRMMSHSFTRYKSPELKEQIKNQYLIPFVKECADLAKTPSKEGYYKLANSLNKIQSLALENKE